MARRIFTFRKFLRKIERAYISLLSYIDHDIYMKAYIEHLRKSGMNIGNPIYIGRNTFFDGTDYSLITIKDSVVISSEVLFLTHDFSISRAAAACGKKMSKEIALKGQIIIEENSFIGRRATILPNTFIGHDSIIGASAVVKGHVAPYSIMIGNPAKKIGDTREWFKKKQDLLGDRI